MIKVLIIEDNEPDISILVNAIKQSGLEIETIISRSINEAIQLNNEGNFDCIFLDYYFPENNGSDFLRYYNSKNKNGNIIMVTSQEDVHMAVECMKLGASDFLTKNQITPASIGKSLRYVLKIKEAREDAERAESALLESEFKLKNIIAKSPIILFNIDKDGRITIFRGKAAQCLSVRPESILDRNLNEFQDELPIRWDDFQKARSTNETNYKTEVNGHYFDVNYIPIRYDQHQNNGTMGVAIDITSFIKNEEVLLNTITVKEGAAKIKEQFLANMSHEIRTPIHGIISLTQFVLNTTVSDEQKKYLELIRKSADTLLVIVNDILDLSKIDSGKLVFEETPFSVKDTIQTAVASFIPKTTEKNIELKTEVSKHLPDYIIGDPVRLTQIINNLLGNAVKFTDKGSVCLSVSAENAFDENISLSFKISDTGIGIPAHKIESVFDSFTQAGDDITRKYGGTGLGLTITKQLVERQNGNILVESEFNKGTTFTFNIPYKVCTENKADCNSEQKADFKLPASLKVLVAEDHDINRFIIERMFKDWGLQTEFAVTGIEAVKAASEKIYDVILMDIEMPDMNGYKATEIIRAELPAPNNQVPIIAMTGHAMTGEKEKCIGIGMNDYLSKPFKPEELKERIATLISTTAQSETSIPKQPDELIGKTTENTPEESEIATPIINLDFLKEISENNDQFFVEFIQMFLTNTPVSISEIETGINTMNWEAVRQAAHKMKPSFNYVGLKELSALSSKIEEMAKKQENMEAIKANLASIKNTCKRAFVELEQEIKIISNN